MWNKTDDKATYFMIGDVYKTHEEQRQHQSTLFLLSYILYVTKCLCKNYTFCVTKRNKNYSCVTGVHMAMLEYLQQRRNFVAIP